MRKVTFWISFVFFLLGWFGLFHQRFCTSGGWFDWNQFWHHESLIALCFCVSLTILTMGKLEKHD